MTTYNAIGFLFASVAVGVLAGVPRLTTASMSPATAVPATRVSRLPGNSQEDFTVQVERTSVRQGLISGKISVNGQVIGETFENGYLKVSAKTYKGLVRYWSGSGFEQGPFGTIGQKGDFLLEVADVVSPQGRKRTDVLFHGGNKVRHSKGCVLLGPIPADRALGDDHALRKMRLLFYGKDVPDSTPNKNITISIKDSVPAGTTLAVWKGEAKSPEGTIAYTLTFKHAGDNVSGIIQVDGESTNLKNLEFVASPNNNEGATITFAFDDVQFKGTVSRDFTTANGTATEGSLSATWSMSVNR
jgi:hypothetical protein